MMRRQRGEVMASVFVSHSSRDRAATERVVARLRAAGFAALFVDFDPDQGIPAGRDWERELYTQLRRTDAVVFLASQASVASSWCVLEVGLARSLGRPVFPLRLQPEVALPLLADVQWTDLTDAESGLDRLLAGLRSAGLDPADSFAWNPHRSPYPGLVPFAPEDAAVFFGRRPETHRLAELLTPTLQHGPGRFVAVVGPSGSGKSSLVHAGLLPRLARSPERWVVVPPLRPGREPTAALAGGLARAFADRGLPRPTEELTAVLEQGPVGLVELAGQLADLAGNGVGRPSVLIVIDQAEELLTRTGVGEQQAFLQLLSGSLHENSPVWAVATVRSEFLSTAPDRAGLAEAIDDPLVVEPLSRRRLAEVIARPAQRAGLDLEPGLVERIVEDTAGGDALPLLAYTLHELYQRTGADGHISAADYEAVGGVVGALRSRADRLTEELDRRGLGALVLPTLMRLATVTGEEQATRRRVRCDVFSANERAVINAFVDVALLVSDQGPTGPGDEAVVEVAHEALLRQWPPLRDAIEADRDLLRVRTELERLAADWQHGGHDDAYLLRGGRLAAIDQWATRHPEELGSLECEFLDASRGLATRTLEATRRSNRRLRTLAAGLALLLVAALVAGGLAVNANQRAQDQTRLAQAQARLALSRQLASEADRLVDSRPDVAILAGLQSLSLARDHKPQPSDALMTALGQVTHASRLLTRQADEMRGVAFSPNGTLLATTSLDRTVRLWDVATGQPHGTPLTGHTDAVRGAAFSPDGRLLATTSLDRTVRLWDVATGQPHGTPLTGHTDSVIGMAFSPDGRLLATASIDRTVRLWDIATGQLHGTPLTGHTDAVYDVAFSPNGALLATASADRTVRLWNVSTRQTRGAPLEGHTDAVRGVAFSPDGALLATTSDDRTVRLWDVATDQPQPHGAPLTGHTDEVRGVAFSPDGALLATGSLDRTVRLWDVATGQPHGAPLTGHTNWVMGVAFSPDGALLATTSADRTVRLWDVGETYSISRPLTGHADAVSDVAFSPDGALLATTSLDRTVRLWDIATGKPHGAALEGHTREVSDVAFSPDGALLATTSVDRTVRLWDVATGQPHGTPLTGHTDAVRGVAFSPDGRLLATGSLDRTVRLWDVATGQPHGTPLTGHTDTVRGVAFSPDGALLATTSADRTVRLWDVATDQPQPHGAPLTGHTDEVRGVAFSPDGRLLATTSSDRTVRLWDVSTRQIRGAPLEGHTDAVRGVAFSPDGALLATGGLDRTVRLWDVATGQPHGTPLTGRIDTLADVAFSPDGRLVATAGADRTVRLWDPSFNSWVTAGCRLVNQNLPMSEWDQLLPGVPYERTCPDLPSGEGAPPGAPAAAYSQ